MHTVRAWSNLPKKETQVDVMAVGVLLLLGRRSGCSLLEFHSEKQSKRTPIQDGVTPTTIHRTRQYHATILSLTRSRMAAALQAWLQVGAVDR